ncbi:MAG: hypothetical protein LBL25_00700 [Oscillospiraceae bacterium]|jgi:hypothetical protein|nr:hypothetical protein [Oscillospiraceae bacterium]
MVKCDPTSFDRYSAQITAFDCDRLSAGMRAALISGKDRPVTTLLFLDGRTEKNNKVIAFCQFQCYCIRDVTADPDDDDLVPAVLATSFAVDKEYQKRTISATRADGAQTDWRISEYVLNIFVDHIKNIDKRHIRAQCIILFSASSKLAGGLYTKISFEEITWQFKLFKPRYKRDGEYTPMIYVLDETLIKTK